MIRPLSKELQKIAIEEMHEDPNRVQEDIQHIQEWINQQDYLNAPKDQQWILGFLRGSKFNLRETKETFERYYTLKSLIPEMMQSRDINSKKIQAILKAGILLPLPYSANHKGPRIILTRYQNLDKSIMDPESLAALLYMILTILMIEDDNFIVSGFLFWNDLSSFPISFLPHFTPKILKNIFECLNNAFPFQIKGVHWSGSPEAIQKFLTILKKYFGPKLKDRLFVYSADNFEDIFKAIPKSYMPKEYKGENSNIEEITDYWIKKVESYSAWFNENNQYSTIEAMRPGKPISLDDVIGIGGSFENLNID